MAVAVHITPHRMTKADYEQVVSDLEASGCRPDGRLYHAAYGDDDLRVFEVWESPEQFETHRAALFNRLQASGIDGGTVEVHPLHSRPD